MIVYGLASYRVNEVIEFFPSRDAAEEALRRVLRDAPELQGEIGVEAVEFGILTAPDEGPAYGPRLGAH